MKPGQPKREIGHSAIAKTRFCQNATPQKGFVKMPISTRGYKLQCYTGPNYPRSPPCLGMWSCLLLGQSMARSSEDVAGTAAFGERRHRQEEVEANAPPPPPDVRAPPPPLPSDARHRRRPTHRIWTSEFHHSSQDGHPFDHFTVTAYRRFTFHRPTVDSVTTG